MASRELRVEIVGDANSLTRALGKASKSTGSFSSGIGKIGKVAALGFGAIAVGSVAAGKKMIDLASDAAEVDSKMKVVFGKELPGLKKNLDEFATATGASRYELRQQAADMGALLRPMVGNRKGAAEMSTQMVKLAADLGSFNNVPTADALLAIRSGLVGETEPLRQFGILLNADAVAQEGLRLGLVKGKEEMTEGEKVLARRSLIMKQSSLATDDATETAGSMANQMKALKNNVTDAATSLGAVLIPYALSLVKAVNDNWPTIEKVIKAVMTGIIAGVKGVVTAIQWLMKQWDIHRDTVIAAWNAVKNAVMGTIDWFKANVVPAIQNIVTAVKAYWDRFGADTLRVLKTTFTVVIAVVKTFIQNILAPFKIGLALLRGDWGKAWNEIKATVSRTWNVIVTILKGAISIALTLAKAIGKAILDGIAAGVRGLANKIGEQMQRLWDALRSAATTAYQAAKRIGEQVIQGIWNGIKAKIDWLKNMIEDALGFLGKLTGVGSTVEEASAKWIGRPIMEGTAKEVVRLTPFVSERANNAMRTVVKSANKAVRDAEKEFASAWASLAVAGQKAIEGKYDGWKPPSLKLAEKMRLDDEIKAVNDAVKNAKTDLDKAIADQGAAKQELATIAPEEGETPEDFAKRKEDAVAAVEDAGEAVKNARDQLAAAERARTIYNLEQKAKDELDQHNKDVAAEKGRFAKRLQNIRDFLAEHPAQWREAHKRLMTLFGDFDIDYRNAGAKLGREYAKGLKQGIAAVGGAVDELAAAIAKKLKGQSPPKEGPLSDIDKWGTALFVDEFLGNVDLSKVESTAEKIGAAVKEGFWIGATQTGSGGMIGEDYIRGLLTGKDATPKSKSQASSSASSVAEEVGHTTGTAFVEAIKGPIAEGGISGGGGSKDRKTRGAMGKEGSMPKAITDDEIQGDRPAWADQEIWGLLGRMTVAEGKWAELLDAVQRGSFKSNAGLIDQLFRRRTRWNWNDPSFSPRLRRMFELMSGPEGWSGKQVADYFGLMKTGGITTKDGFAFLHKNEAVIPLPREGSQRSIAARRENVTVTFNGPVYGGTPDQLARVLTPAIIEQMRTAQSRGAPAVNRIR